ncbi:MAG TPA: molybdate ABC transporter substrate-binding protein [Pedobacter sp.]|uniref:molybdate ABC transporter substrate-binding protein n=1 Tax=Pedobacter sp. TaxID=1411316 RepID=UPI002C8F7449|nr:molybdate ABC transporter substrate-binding protein [Pedobacter sp.]HMI02948.1 molybdate ABC transporter substrate-binding protein [Pedobacter sp.]
MKKLFALLFLMLSLTAQAQTLRVAVAANAQFVMKALQADFKKKTGIETEMISGSSGKLTAQIKNGAPYDVFLSADMDFPEALYNEGFGINRPKVYALGSLIVCSSSDFDVKNWRSLLTGIKTNKIAIANPALAPYGKAAKQALRRYGLWDKISPKIVFGESISQVNTYISAGVVSLGFTTEALVYESPDAAKLKWAKIDHKAYEEIQQGMLILAYAKKGNLDKALKFFNYLQSPAARQLFVKNGYRIP